MASKYYFKSTSAIAPKPTGMVDGVTFDTSTYTAAKDVSTTNGSTTLRLDRSYTYAQDNSMHNLKMTNWLTPALAAQSIASQVWTINVAGLTVTDPAPGNARFAVRLFIWDGDTDSFSSYIGTTAFTSTLTTTSTQYSATVTAAATLTDRQRIGVDVYPNISDNTSAPASPITIRFQYDNSTTEASLSSPATLTEYVAPSGGTALYHISYTP